MANLRLETEFVLSIIREKLPFTDVIKSDFEATWLSHNVEIYEYILTYWQTNGKLPSEELIQTRFPAFLPVEIRDNPKDILDALRKGTEGDRFQTELNNTINLFKKTGNVQAASIYLEGKLETFNNSDEQDVFDLADADSAKLLSLYIERQRQLKEQGFVGIPTGFGPELDGWMNGGSMKGDLYGLLAPLGVGKTWSMMILANAALENHFTPFILALEGTLEKEGYRALSATANLSNSGLHTATLSELEIRDALDRLQAKAKKFNGHFYLGLHGDREVYTPSTLRQKIIKYKPSLVIVDYLSLMGTKVAAADEWAVFSEVSKQLKRTAISLNVPIWATLQGNRASSLKEQLTSNDSSYYNLLRDFDTVLGLTKVPQSDNLVRVNTVKGRDNREYFNAVYKTNWNVGKVQFVEYEELAEGF